MSSRILSVRRESKHAGQNNNHLYPDPPEINQISKVKSRYEINCRFLTCSPKNNLFSSFRIEDIVYLSIDLIDYYFKEIKSKFFRRQSFNYKTL